MMAQSKLIKSTCVDRLLSSVEIKPYLLPTEGLLECPRKTSQNVLVLK